MTETVDFYFSFRSPYSALAAPQIAALAREWDVSFRLLPVLPLAVRDPEFFRRANPLFLPYLIRDVGREAARLSIPFGPPMPDPIVMNPAEMRASPDQPYIYRITRMACAAQELGKGLEFAVEIAALIWGGAPNWHEEAVLAPACARLGLDYAKLEASATEEAERWDEMIAGNQKSLESLGHWGVPTFGLRGEPFFGQDRIDALSWRLRELGVKRRNQGPVSRDFLIGNWQLKRWELYKNDQMHSLPHSETSTGRLCYGADGTMSAFLQNPLWPEADKKAAPQQADFIAYAGEWQLDGDKIRHRVAFSSYAPWNQRDIFRQASRMGSDHLRLETPKEAGRDGAIYFNRLDWQFRYA